MIKWLYRLDDWMDLHLTPNADFILLFKKVLNFLLPFVKYSVEIVCITLNFVYQYSAQQETKDVIQKNRA